MSASSILFAKFGGTAEAPKRESRLFANRFRQRFGIPIIAHWNSGLISTVQLEQEETHSPWKADRIHSISPRFRPSSAADFSHSLTPSITSLMIAS